jgi:hypothetical protein
VQAVREGQQVLDAVVEARVYGRKELVENGVALRWGFREE